MRLNEWGGRKFLLCCAALSVCSVLVWFGKISDDVFSVVVLATVGAYVAGNVAQKRIEVSNGDGARGS